MGTESIHKEHRKRLKKRFLDNGLDDFTDIQALELLLFYAIPRRDTNVLAHALLERFGSLSQVLEADAADLKKVNGIGEEAALLLTLMPQLARFYQVDSAKRVKCLTSLEDCGRYLLPYFFGTRNETVYLLCLDAKGRVLSCSFLAEGRLDRVGLNSRQVVETALEHRATSVILAHNHTSGIALPSREDEETTNMVQAALEAVGIRLADHMVMVEDDFVSMADSGFFGRR